MVSHTSRSHCNMELTRLLNICEEAAFDLTGRFTRPQINFSHFVSVRTFLSLLESIWLFLSVLNG